MILASDNTLLNILRSNQVSSYYRQSNITVSEDLGFLTMQNSYI